MDICHLSSRYQKRRIAFIVTLISFLNCFLILIYTQQSNNSSELATSLCDNFVSDTNQLKVLNKQYSAITPLDLKLQPWKDDPECAQFLIEFIRHETHQQKPMALTSFPGSGSTYVRGMIERMTGYFTGSLYADKDMYTKGLYGEMMEFDCGCTIVQKAHHYYYEREDNDNWFNGSAILIIRNPYKAMISWSNYLATLDHTKHAPKATFVGKDWENFVSTQLKEWKDTMISVLCRMPPRHSRSGGGVLHYENLLHDKSNELRKLMKYLNLPVDEQRLRCTLKHDYTAFQRKTSSAHQHTVSPYSTKQKEMIDSTIAMVQEALQVMGHEPMPLKFYDYFNSSSTTFPSSKLNTSFNCTIKSVV